MDKRILDVCCGSKCFYFDKHNPDVLFCDCRRENKRIQNNRTCVVDPDEIHDFKNLPKEWTENFDLVVFDPPHLLRAGETGWLFAKYGRLSDTWKDDLSKGFLECWRCLRIGGTLIFKWNEEQIPLSEVLKLAPFGPLLGNRSGKKTHWIVFYKGANECTA